MSFDLRDQRSQLGDGLGEFIAAGICLVMKMPTNNFTTNTKRYFKQASLFHKNWPSYFETSSSSGKKCLALRYINLDEEKG